MSTAPAVEIRPILKALTLAQAELERELTTLVGNSLSAFEATWGVGVKRVDVTVIEVTAMGDPLPNYVMGPVRVELTLTR